MSMFLCAPLVKYFLSIHHFSGSSFSSRAHTVISSSYLCSRHEQNNLIVKELVETYN